MRKNDSYRLEYQVLLSKSDIMKTKNFVQLIGYLGNDPEIYMTTSGQTFGRLRMATNISYKREDGSFSKKTTWHDISVWNKLAKKLEGNFIRGSHILVEGQIQYRTFLDYQGHKRYVTEIKATNILNLDR